MKKFEFVIRILLSILFIYSSIELLFAIPGNLQISPTILVPFRINGTVMLWALLASIVPIILFPLWNVGLYFGVLRVSEIMRLKREYKADFISISVGFLGLTFWCGAEKVFDSFWWVGAPLVALSLIWIVLSISSKVTNFVIQN